MKQLTNQIRHLFSFLFLLSFLLWLTCLGERNACGQEPDQEILTADHEQQMTKPVKVKSPSPKYPKVAEYIGEECTVIIETYIDEHGDVRDPKVFPDGEICLFQNEFDEAALEAVQKWKFKPALLDGKPVEISFTLTVGFKLKSGKKRIDHPELIAQAYINRGVAYFKKEQYEKAIDDYTTAMKYWSYEQAYGNRAYIHYMLKHYHEAISDYTRALEMAPDNGKFYFFRGLSYVELSDCEKARNDFAKSCSLDYIRACSTTCP
ncbi:TonB family protein [bacterium]|nr:TonB family protein [bacterium]